MTGSLTRRVLAGVPLFQGLDAKAVTLISQQTVLRKLSSNEMLFREGEPCRGLYITLDGSIRIYRSTPDGQEQTLHVEGPKKTLAELTLFDGAPYPASARAAEPSRVLFLPLRDFQQLYHENPEIADAVIVELGRRIKRLVRLVGRISLKNVPARVASALLEEAELAGAAHDGGSFSLPYTQEDLAAELSTTRESVSRAIRGLRENGALSRRGTMLRIDSLSALQEAAGPDPALAPEALYSSAFPAPLR